MLCLAERSGNTGFTQGHASPNITRRLYRKGLAVSPTRYSSSPPRGLSILPHPCQQRGCDNVSEFFQFFFAHLPLLSTSSAVISFSASHLLCIARYFPFSCISYCHHKLRVWPDVRLQMIAVGMEAPAKKKRGRPRKVDQAHSNNSTTTATNSSPIPGSRAAPSDWNRATRPTGDDQPFRTHSLVI
jgi:hypothetical protein